MVDMNGIELVVGSRVVIVKPDHGDDELVGRLGVVGAIDPAELASGQETVRVDGLDTDGRFVWGTWTTAEKLTVV